VEVLIHPHQMKEIENAVENLNWTKYDVVRGKKSEKKKKEKKKFYYLERGKKERLKKNLKEREKEREKEKEDYEKK